MVIWSGNRIPFAQFNPFSITSFGRDMNGEVYMVATGSGEIIKIVDITSSIQTPTKSTQLVIQNPVHETLTLKADISFDVARLVDFGGRTVIEFSAHDRTVNVDQLATGIYLLSVRKGSELFVQKIIIN